MIGNWRHTVDEDGQYCFYVALFLHSPTHARTREYATTHSLAL